MLSKISIIASYAIITLLVGLFVKKRQHTEGYFLAGRKLTSFPFIATMAATNLSAFTIFGASGAGYRQGMPFFLVMGFGTGFMSLTFLIVGRKIWKIGKKHSLITPSQLIGKLYPDKKVSALFSLVLLLFTLPYVALQPYAAGRILETLFGMPSYLGATLTTLAIVAYTMRGGLKAIVVTDILQGMLMLVLLILSFILVCNHYGGIFNAFEKLYDIKPQLLSPSGSNYNPALYLSFIMLWFYCDPLFPQLFQRFYTAKSELQIIRCAVAYPIICTCVFFLPIAIGTLGNIDFTNLPGNQSDSIMALLLTKIGGDIFGTLVLTAGIAALMSTLDSQLLTLSSIFTHDILPMFLKRSKQIRMSDIAISRLAVVVIALCGLAIALVTDTTLLKLGMTTFIGLGVLFPTLFFGIYLKSPSPTAAIISIIFGETLTLLFHYKLISITFIPTPAFILFGTTCIYLGSYLLINNPKFTQPLKHKIILLIIILFPIAVVYSLPQSRWFFAYLAIPSVLQSLASWYYYKKILIT